jgi:hypothetical protein
MNYKISKKKQLILYIKTNFNIIFISLLGNFFIFCYQIYAGKFLNPVDFGTLTALNSLFGIFCIPVTIIQISAISNFTKVLKRKKILELKFFFKKFYKINFYFSFLYMLFIYLTFNNFFSLSKSESFFNKNIFFLNIFLTYLVSPFLILIQSNQYYTKYSLVGLFQSFFRFLFLLILFSFYQNYSSGLVANMLSTFVIFFFLILFYKSYIFNAVILKNYFLTRNNWYFYFDNINISILLVIYTVFVVGFDIIVFREIFPTNLAGYYSGVSMISKIPMYILSLTLLYFYTESFYSKNKKNRFRLVVLFSFAFFLIVLFGIFFYFFGKIILTILFNSNFSIFSNELLILMVAFCFMALSKILCYILISRKLWKFFIFIFFILLITTLFLIFSENILNFSLILLFSFISQFLYVLVYSWKKIM